MPAIRFTVLTSLVTLTLTGLGTTAGGGVGFLLADHGDPAGSEFQDVLDGIAALVERGVVDGSRVGIMGGSYGGYFSAWGATHESAHFRSAVVNFGVSNLFSDWGDGDIPWEHRLVHWGWFPMHRPLLAMDRSPVSWTRGSRTATPIMHGKDDPRVPAAQSRELYQGLRLNEGLPVELVLLNVRATATAKRPIVSKRAGELWPGWRLTSVSLPPGRSPVVGESLAAAPANLTRAATVGISV